MRHFCFVAIVMIVAIGLAPVQAAATECAVKIHHFGPYETAGGEQQRLEVFVERRYAFALAVTERKNGLLTILFEQAWPFQTYRQVSASQTISLVVQKTRVAIAKAYGDVRCQSIRVTRPDGTVTVFSQGLE